MQAYHEVMSFMSTTTSAPPTAAAATTGSPRRPTGNNNSSCQNCHQLQKQMQAIIQSNEELELLAKRLAYKLKKEKKKRLEIEMQLNNQKDKRDSINAERHKTESDEQMAICSCVRVGAKPEEEERANQRHSFKGRVTVYSISGCPHCKATKALLKEQGIPYVDINLDVHPERRAEMTKKTSLRTVPQVFFNEIFLGGYDALQEAVMSGKIDELLQHVKDNETPVDNHDDDAPAELETGNTDAVMNSPFGDEIICEPDESSGLVERMRKAPGLVQNRLWHFRMYKRCFVGKDAVDWLMSPDSGLRLASRMDAVQFGNRLMDERFFHHVTFDHPFRDENLFYRFLQDNYASDTALNAATSSVCAVRPAHEVAEDLRRLILAIYDEFLSDDGKSVDYAGIAQSDSYKRYLLQAAELQRVDLSNLTREEKIAFFINVYNAMVIHANVELGPPTNALQRNRFFNKVSYILGGHTFSLNDIEHGILRGNKKPPAGLSRQFGRTDPRLPLCLKYTEPRIHFALVCGAKSCPPIKTYRAHKIDGELTASTQAFFEDGGIVLNEARREIRLSRIMEWYSSDFGNSVEEMLRWLCGYLPQEDSTRAALLAAWLKEGNYKVTYLPYDWTTNTK